MEFNKGLHAIVIAASIIPGCQVNKQHVISHSQLEKSIEDIVRDGIKLFNEGKIPETQALLEAYKKEKPKSFTASAHCLLAPCYVDSINLSNIAEVSGDIRDEFTALNDKFVKEPLILLQVQEKFVELFQTEGYKRIESKIERGITFEPVLYGALFLLHLAQRKYESARDYAIKFLGLKKFKALPNPQEIIRGYQNILIELSGHASKVNDYNVIIGCARVAEAFLSAPKNNP